MRWTLIAVGALLAPVTGFAQNTARMEQVVQSFAANDGFTGAAAR